MSYTHSFDPVAFEEYKKAIEWYGERSIMALDNFILAVNKKNIGYLSFSKNL